MRRFAFMVTVSLFATITLLRATGFPRVAFGVDAAPSPR